MFETAPSLAPQIVSRSENLPTFVWFKHLKAGYTRESTQRMLARNTVYNAAAATSARVIAMPSGLPSAFYMSPAAAHMLSQTTLKRWRTDASHEFTSIGIQASALPSEVSKIDWSRPYAAQRLREAIAGYSNREASLDGSIIDFGKLLVDSVPWHIPLPNVRPTIDGEISFSWAQNGSRVELMIDPEERRLIWAAKFDGHYVNGGDELWSDTAALPNGLIRMLVRLHK